MGVDKSVTPKASLTVKNIGSGWKSSDAVVTGSSTIKIKRSKVNASLAFTDATVKDPKSLRDVLLTADYKASKAVTLNFKFDVPGKKYTVGGTWDGTVAKKPSTVKLSWSNKDNLVAGDVTMGIAKGQKTNLTFNNQRLLGAKYTLSKGDYIVEPSYNFVKKGVAASVTRKLSAKDTLKLTYDVKSEAATAEWARKPFKVAVSSSVSKKLNVGRPTISATFENVYEL